MTTTPTPGSPEAVAAGCKCRVWGSEDIRTRWHKPQEEAEA